MLYTAILIGLLGSLGHCTGMCAPLVLLLGRGHSASSLLWAHLGRVLTYTILGLLSSSLGQMLAQRFPAWPWLQGALALAFALAAFYMALALTGKLPPLESALPGWTRLWGQAFRGLRGQPPAKTGGLLLTGMLWGLLPCGVVLSALLLAAAQPQPWLGGLFMSLFGLATLPGLLLADWGARRLRAADGPAKHWPLPAGLFRHAAAVLMALAGLQFALRGLAAWGLTGHLMLGPLMVW